jgi:hypothetical protein
MRRSGVRIPSGPRNEEASPARAALLRCAAEGWEKHFAGPQPGCGAAVFRLGRRIPSGPPSRDPRTKRAARLRHTVAEAHLDSPHTGASALLDETVLSSHELAVGARWATPCRGRAAPANDDAAAPCDQPACRYQAGLRSPAPAAASDPDHVIGNSERLEHHDSQLRCRRDCDHSVLGCEYGRPCPRKSGLRESASRSTRSRVVGLVSQRPRPSVQRTRSQRG